MPTTFCKQTWLLDDVMHTDINQSVKRLAITCLWNWKWRTTILPKWFVIPRCVSLLDIPHLPVVILNPVVLGVVAEAEGSEWALVTLSHGVLPPCIYCILVCFTSMTHGGERIDGMSELETTCCSVFFFLILYMWRVTSWTPPLATEKSLLQKLQRMKEVPFLLMDTL